MVTVAKTVVDEGAMVIEQLDTVIANVAMKACLALDHLAVGAQVIKMQANFKCSIHDSNEIVRWFEVSWLQRHCCYEERHDNEEKCERDGHKNVMDGSKHDDLCAMLLLIEPDVVNEDSRQVEGDTED